MRVGELEPGRGYVAWVGDERVRVVVLGLDDWELDWNPQRGRWWWAYRRSPAYSSPTPRCVPVAVPASVCPAMGPGGRAPAADEWLPSTLPAMAILLEVPAPA